MTSREGLMLGLLAAALCYAPVGRAHFVYDDRWMLVENPAVQALTPGRYFADPTTVAAAASGLDSDIYRPLATLSLAVDYRLWGMDPVGFHLENLLLHLACGILLWLLFRALLGSTLGASFAAAIFLLHPLQVQTVAWVSQRSGLLSTFFGLLMLLALLPDAPSKRRLWLGWFCGLVCVFSKESGIVFPALLWLVRSVSSPERSGRSIDRRYDGLFAGVLACLVLRWHALHQWSQIAGHALFQRSDLALGVMAFPMYLGKMLAPLALRPSYDYPHGSRLRIAASLLFFIFYAGCTVWLWRRRRPLGISLGWIFLALLPVLQLLPIRAFFAERFAYAALAGFALGMGWLWNRFPLFRWVGVAWLTALVWVTWKTVPVWRNSATLWAYAVRQEPTNAFAHASYAETMQDPSQAVAEYERALANHPSPEIRFDAVNNLAWLKLRQRQPGEALFWAIQAAQLEPESVAALYNLCAAALQVGDLDRARDAYQRLQKLPATPPPMLRSLAPQIAHPL